MNSVLQGGEIDETQVQGFFKLVDQAAGKENVA
jgi:hypothetical protein